MAMLQLQKDVEKLTNSAKLSNAVQDVDRIINLLSEARESVAAGEYLLSLTPPSTIILLRFQIINGLPFLCQRTTPMRQVSL